jgi:hypothetical protein
MVRAASPDAGGDRAGRALARRSGYTGAMSASRFESIPAWRIARLREALRDAMRRGADSGESGEDLDHRALRRRFAIGRQRALADAATPRRKTTRKGRRFPLRKQIAIWRAIFATRPAQWRPGDKAPFGSIAKAHRSAALACQDLGLAPPRYRTVYVLWRHGVASAEVMQALSGELR